MSQVTHIENPGHLNTSNPLKLMRLKQLQSIKNRILQLTEDLNTLIHSMPLNKTLFSRAATAWGAMPFWLKSTAWSVLLVPLLFVGISAAPIAFLIAISLLPIATYFGFMALFENYNNQNKETTKHLKTGIEQISQSIDDFAIESFNELNKLIDAGLEQAQKEKKQDLKQIKQLENVNKKLSLRMEQYKETECALNTSQSELKETISALQTTCDTQTQLIQKNKEELECTIKDHQSNQDKLDECIQKKSLYESEIQKMQTEHQRFIGQISQLHETSTELSKQREQQLIEQIQRLNEEINTLAHQTQCLINTEQMLRKTQHELEQTTQTLKTSIEEQSQVLEKSQSAYARVLLDFENSQSQLSEHVTALHNLKTTMRLEAEKAHTISETLRSAVSILSNAVIKDEQQRNSFEERLTAFLTNKETSFDQITSKMEDTERALVQVTEELRQSNERYNALLDKQDRHITRLEQINTPPSYASALGKCGFYASDEASQLIRHSTDSVLLPSSEICSNALFS